MCLARPGRAGLQGLFRDRWHGTGGAPALRGQANATRRHRLREGVVDRIPGQEAPPVHQASNADARTDFEAEGVTSMPLTRSFRETVARRARSDAAFRAALVEEAVQNILDGDVETALGQLRDVVN